MTSTFFQFLPNVGSHIKIFILTFLLLVHFIFSIIEAKESKYNRVKTPSINLKNSFFIAQANGNVTRTKIILKKRTKRKHVGHFNCFVLDVQKKPTLENGETETRVERERDREKEREKNSESEGESDREREGERKKEEIERNSEDRQNVETKEDCVHDSFKETKEMNLLFPEVVKQQEEDKKRENNNVSKSDERFSDFEQINKQIVNFLEKKGITHMTKIQAQCFKPVFDGRDMIARSETGTGKTLAFALPLVEKLYIMKNEQLNKEEGKSKKTIQISMEEEKETENMEQMEQMEKTEITKITKQTEQKVEGERKKEEEFTKNNEENEEIEEIEWSKIKTNFEHPAILVLEPTRELSKQVENTFKEISQFYNFNILSIYGGASYTYQENKLKKGVDILTGTPGRIFDHLEKKTLSLKNIKFLILDEADEMLNLGFTHDIERILKHINLKEAQILLFSATTPQWVKDLSSKYLKKPLFIDVINSTNKTSKTINHIAIKTPYDIKEKALLLEDLILVKSNGGQTIIFTRTKLEADILCSECSFKSLTFSVLHGNIAQSTREHTMQRFRQNMFQILIATDIAARGLDISNVDLVIQLYPPNYSSIYIHRSGRTGRANKKGTSIVLFSDEDQHELLKIEKNCGIKFQTELLPTNEMVFECSSYLAAQKLDKVNKQVLPYFVKTAEDLIKRSKKIGMTQKELISRCLALISKKEQIKKRSLLNGLSDTITLCFMNKIRNWKNENDIIYWINKISNELNVNTYNKVLQIKIDTKNKKFSFFDLNDHMAQLLVQNFNTMSKEEYRRQLNLFVPTKIPDHLNLDEQLQTHNYSPFRKKYSYWKTNRTTSSRRF